MTVFIIRNDEIKKRAISEIQNLLGEWQITIGKVNRTRAQNDYFWTLAELLGSHFGHSKDAIKDMLMVGLGFYDDKEIDGKIYTVVRTTTKLNKEEFSRLIDSCFIMGNADNVVLPLASFYGLGD